MPWNYRRFGTAVRPIHKSDLVEITGDFGCPRRFKFTQDALADNVTRDRSDVVGAKTVLGSAVHETLSRALTNELVFAQLQRTGQVNEDRVRLTLTHEIQQASDGRVVDWERSDPKELLEERVAMCMGALRSVRGRIGHIEMIEAGFVAQIDGMHFAGHVDLVYRPASDPDALALADWKTGMQKPDELELDHGWEAGIYSYALKHGTFLPREYVLVDPAPDGNGYWGQYINGDYRAPGVRRSTRWQAERDGLEAALERVAAGDQVPGARRFDQFPSQIHVVHLHDYVPYVKSGAKEVKRDEDVEHYAVPRGTKVKYAPGDLRGPAWLPVRRKENDIPRLAYRLRTVVGTVRMGRFLDLVGEKCKRCAFKHECLNGGYQLRGEELQEVERTLKEAGL